MTRAYAVTFGQQYPREPHPYYAKAHRDGWVEVEARTRGEAAVAAWRLFGPDFSNIYLLGVPERIFVSATFPRGCLDAVKADDVLWTLE